MVRRVRSGNWLPRRDAHGLILQTRWPELRKVLLPFIERMLGDPDQVGEISGR